MSTIRPESEAAGNKTSDPRTFEPGAGALASEEGVLVREGGAPSDRGAPASRGTAPRREEGALARVALRFTTWAERWFPDAFMFVAIAVVVVAAAALLNGAPVQAVTKAFGDGFWSLITFTMQMVFVAVGGYVVASSPPAQHLILRLAQVPRTGRVLVGLASAFRRLPTPVIGRIEDDAFWLDCRCLEDVKGFTRNLVSLAPEDPA